MSKDNFWHKGVNAVNTGKCCVRFMFWGGMDVEFSRFVLKTVRESEGLICISGREYPCGWGDYASFVALFLTEEDAKAVYSSLEAQAKEEAQHEQ